jgi:hypothetical protein
MDKFTEFVSDCGKLIVLYWCGGGVYGDGKLYKDCD